MPAPCVYEYALIRAVPRVERGEFLNVGVLLFCAQRRFLAARVAVDAGRLRSLDPSLDIALLRSQLEHVPILCAGGPPAGPIGELALAERFRWLAAPRSAILQPSAVHLGLCEEEPEAVLERLFAQNVGLGGAGGVGESTGEAS